MPEISVIMTSYNQPELVIEAIESVVDQTYNDWELWIGDDNSNKKTQDAIKEYLHECRDPRIKLYKSDVQEIDRRDKVRYSVLHNIGYRQTSGKYITYLTTDDIYLPTRFEKMVEEFKNCEWKDILCALQYCEVLDYDFTPLPSNYKKEIRRIRPYPEKVMNGGILLQPAWVIDQTSVMLKREVIEKVGGENAWTTDPRWWGFSDAVLWCNLVRAGYFFYVIPKVLDVHRYTPYSLSSKKVKDAISIIKNGLRNNTSFNIDFISRVN